MIQNLTAMSKDVLYGLLLDLHNSYYDMDRDRCLDILGGYGIGPQNLRLLRKYWYRLTIVSQTSEYYGAPFKGYQGIQKEHPLFPTIFNVVVDAVIRKWLEIVSEKAVGLEGFSRVVQRMPSFKTADDILINSMHLKWLQWWFDVPIGIFDREGL